MENRFETFTSLILSINRSIQKIKNVEMEELGLKGKQVQCLYHLYKEKDGLNAKELSRYCEEDKAAISRTLKELVNGDYIFIEEQDDRKYRKPIKLTEKGNKVASVIVKKIDDVLLQGGDGLDAKERQEFYSKLTLIANNLQRICENKEKKND